MYLAVRDDIKLLNDLVWKDDTVFFRGQRMRGRQGIDCKHSVDVVEYYQVFLEQTDRRTETHQDDFTTMR